MIPLIFTTALKIGKKIAAGVKQKKSLINGVMAAKKIALQTSYIGTSVPISQLSNDVKLNANVLPSVKTDAHKGLSLLQVLSVFAPPLVGLLMLVAAFKYVFHKK